MNREQTITTQKERGNERYRIAPYSIEYASFRMEQYEATPDGARFLRSLELAREFKPIKTWGGMRAMQLVYLLNMADAEGTYKAMSEAINYAYRAGYMAGQRDAKKRASKKG